MWRGQDSHILFIFVGMRIEQTLTLGELLSEVREGVSDLFPERVWVKAEISSVNARSNGHCYMELCESEDGRGVTAKARAVIWRTRYFALSSYFREATGSDLKAGMTILAGVIVSYSELYGLSLTIEEIEPQFTLGEAELQRRRTIARLEEEGLIEKQKELDFPALPYRLAVVSARDAAGYGDFRRHLSENEYGFAFEVVLFEATMQGDMAPDSIVDALGRVETSQMAFDAVLIMRGGGSALDLACFDDYGLCFTIANFPIPVFTAIGHDRDVHVADLVAFESVKTPTALADVFIDALSMEDERIAGFASRLKVAFSTKIGSMESRLVMLEQRIKGADPRNVLSRGYALVADGKGIVLKKAAGIKSGDWIKVMFEDGEVNCKVE